MSPERALLLVELLREAMSDTDISDSMSHVKTVGKMSNAEKCRNYRLRKRHQNDTSDPDKVSGTFVCSTDSSSPSVPSLSASFPVNTSQTADSQDTQPKLTLVPTPTPTPTPATPRVSGDIERVWSKWCALRGAVLKGTPPALTPKRRAILQARMREGFTVARLERAAEGIWTNPWSLEDPAARISFEICYRNAGQVEAYEVKGQSSDSRAAACISAYERAVSDAKGGGYLFPADQRKELGAILRSHCKDESGRMYTGERMLEWISVHVYNFVRDVIDDGKPQYYSGFGPIGFAKYLNESFVKQEARAVP